ncbi:FliM/FliN family flagellar motor C-terminal domain-containing protein [Roseateles sp. NT4]|uniref:FliM/FliN family flagellar motor C-terminal domain-containing protein n=1 Tax=Roseateles sp. NT4 TaxID=3453715 RepID=UPI003EE96228
MQGILWLPESLCEQLAAELQELFTAWTQAWGLPATGPVRARRVSAGESALSPDAIDLLAPPSAAWRGALAQAVFNNRIDSPVVEGVVRRMSERLQEPLRNSFAPQSTIADGASQPCPGHRGIAVTVEMLGKHCGVFLSNDQLIQTGRLRRPASPPLSTMNLEAVTASLPVHLVAELGHTSLNVNDLLQLAPGDVLVLNEELAAPLRLVSPGSALALTAHLGASRDSTQRAVRWATPS